MPKETKQVFWIGDRYCGLFKIGSGGMGEVWAGKALGDRGSERIIAIKRLHYERRRRESHYRALLDEAAVLQHLSASPNIVSILDLRDEDGQPALIMEYVDGPELSDVLSVLDRKGQRLPYPIVAYIVTEISKGLSNAHSCRHPKTGEPLNIVHRDVSPSNILLSSTGAVKLTDFGIAKSEIQTTKTRVGEIKGKYQYMAPEQARGQKVDFRTDYFALGLVFYECLFGKPAYEAETDAEFIEKARNGRISYPEAVQPGLKKVLDRLLAYDPDKRYADLERFRRDMGEIALESGGIATSDDLSSYLAGLNIPQLKEAVERRIQLENAQDIPRRQPEKETGVSSIHKQPWYQNRKWQIGIPAAVAVILSAGYLVLKSSNSAPPAPATTAAIATAPVVSEVAIAQGRVSIETEPSDAIVTLNYGKKKVESPSPAHFSDIPLNEKIRVSAVKADYLEVKDEFELTAAEPAVERKFSLAKKPMVSVRFVSTPPSTVSVPGRLNSVDAPSPVMTIPAGSYSVIFQNPLALSEARAKLDAVSGGNFICTANMQINTATGAPTGDQPSASCRKN